MYEFYFSTKPIRVEALVDAYDVIHPEGYYFPGESHDFWEMVFVCDGSAALTADERVYHLGKGSLVFHKPMEFHRVWSEAGSAPHLIILSFKASGEWISRFEDRCFVLDAAQQKHMETLSGLFLETLDLAETTDAYQYRMILERAVAQLELFLLQLLEKEEVAPVVPQSADAQYTQIVNVMKQNCHRALTLGELARLCNMTVSNMKRIFHRFSDMGIAKYYLCLRMRRAKELLDEGFSACEVAQKLDFSESSYFYTTFKREVGMTPNQYKRSRAAVSEEK